VEKTIGNNNGEMQNLLFTIIVAYLVRFFSTSGLEVIASPGSSQENAAVATTTEIEATIHQTVFLY
jgi:hypothetical protein